jgi:hypothetical protein
MQADDNNSTRKSNAEAKFVLLPKGIIDRLLKHERAADLIALYTFYSYTADWQGTNQPKANNKFVGKGLKWGRDKVPLVKSILVGMGLVEDVELRNPQSKKIEGHFIKIKFFPQLKSHPTGFQWCGSPKATPLVFPPVGKTDPNACSSGTPLNACSPGSGVSAEASTPSPSFLSPSEQKKAGGRSMVGIPSLDEAINHGLSIGLTREDCEAFFDHHSARGWRYKPGLPMRDYKAALRTWKRNAARFAKADDDTPSKPRYVMSPDEQARRRRAARAAKEGKK